MKVKQTIWKSRKVFIDYNNPFHGMAGHIRMLKEPMFQLYYLETYLFGLIKVWKFRGTYHSDPKSFLDVAESNYS